MSGDYRALSLAERYECVFAYVALNRQGPWVTLPAHLARRHEGRSRNPLLALAVGMGAATMVVALLADACRLLGYGDLSSMLLLLRFFVLGAIGAPTEIYGAFLAANPMIDSMNEVIVWLIAGPIILAFLPENWVRYAATVAIAAYVALSIALIPYAVAEWRIHRFVELYGDVRYWTNIPAARWIGGRLTEAFVGDTLLGLIAAYNQIASYLPSALLGFSVILWLPVAARLVGYLLTSEAANLFYANRVRAPLAFYTDPVGPSASDLQAIATYLERRGAVAAIDPPAVTKGYADAS